MAAQKKKATKLIHKKPSVKKKAEDVPVEIIVAVPEETTEEITVETVTKSPQEAALETAHTEEKKEEFNLDDNKNNNASFKKILLWVFAICFLAGAFIASGFLVYKAGVENGEQAMQKKLESQIAPTETPTPTAEEVEKDAYTIKVLNGSGIAGEAGKVKSLLEEEGYTVASIGNASTSASQETEIAVKENVESSWIAGAKQSLEKSYVVSEGDSLSEDETVDVIITVGSKKAE